MKKLAVLAAVLAGLLAGCTPGAGTGTSTPSAASAASTASASSAAASATPTAAALGQVYDLPADRDAFAWGQPLASLTGKKLSKQTLLSRQGWKVDLMGVYRLSDDRVLAEFRLNAAAAVRDDLQVWSDPDYNWWFHLGDRRNGGFTGTAWEFSDVRLTVAGDDASYRAVRTSTNFCLCSMNTNLVKDAGDVPAYVVLSTPKDASSVNLSLRDVGTFSDIAVTPQPAQRSLVPLGFGYQLRLQAVTRPEPGKVRVRFSVEVPSAGIEGSTFRAQLLYVLDGGGPWNSAAFASTRQFQNLISLDPGGVHGGWPQITDTTCNSCTKAAGQLFQPGTAVDLQMDLPDPGSQDVLVATTVGWPLSAVAVEGTPTAGQKLVTYRWRQVTTGVSIDGDDIDLDTAVLFHVDKATLTPKASAVLDRAAKALQAQDGRSLLIVGHTDSTGTTAHNQDLSVRRAKAVKDALAARLGSGWTFTVEGKGESDPQIKETGLSGAKLERARAVNRQVEVRVR